MRNGWAAPLAAVAVALAAGACAPRAPVAPRLPPDGWMTSAPGGQVHVQVKLADLSAEGVYPAGQRLYLRAAHGPATSRTEVLRWSPLGIARVDAAFEDRLAFVSESSRPVREEYDLPHGKRAQYLNQGVERVLTFETEARLRLELVLRVFDDGFAFRYRFPDGDGRRVSLARETTGFRVPASTRAYLQQHDSDEKHRANYQGIWHADLAAGTPSPGPSGWSFPALFSVDGGAHWVLITEAGLTPAYAAAHLDGSSPGGVYRVAFPHPDEAGGKGAPLPSSTLPWETPWRVVIVGGLGTIVESSLVTDLAPPSRAADLSWVRAGRAAWSWWSDNASPKTYERTVPFVDLAAQLRWEYALLDVGWPEMEGGTWRDVVRRGAGKNVGILLWYHADRLRDPVARREEMQAIAAAGVKGIKVDFLESDRQQAVALAWEILEDAARHKLLVNFHGCTVPRGWERTFPHLMTMEAVRGAEHYLSSAAFPLYAPAHNATLPFTRNAVGPMDYTPVTFTHAKNRRYTTWAHELALSVVFESGIVHFADSDEGFWAVPAEVRSFLSSVPAAWDETRLVEGAPGKLAVLARRKGRSWYIAGINGETERKTLTIPLEVIGNGTFDMLLLADGTDDQSFLVTRRDRNGTDTQSVALRGFGGFAMRLTPRQ